MGTSVIELPHVRQKSYWDCGIACVEMVLRNYLGEEFNEEVLNSLGKSLGFGTRVWTIDLANILVHYNVNFVYYTITCGVDPGYRNQEFYQSYFEDDEVRINKLFENAQELGLNVVRRSVTVENIFAKLDQGRIAIVLVNSNLLKCNLCEQKYQNFCDTFSWKLRLGQGEHYAGHYVIVCGYNQGQKTIFYKNPSQEETLCCASIASFESARHCYGTDDDIIFIDLSKGDKKL